MNREQLIKKVRKEMMQNARGYNKHLGKKYMKRKTPRELLCLVGPLERESFEKQLKDLKIYES